MFVYANDEAIPRAWMAREWVVVDTPEAAARMLASGRVDARHTVVLLSGPPLPRVLGADAEADWIDATIQTVTVHKTGSDPGVLVLADAWFPGWTASIDGLPAEVMRADAALRAVVVPGGDHEIHFVYSTSSWNLARWPCMLGCFAVLALLGLARRREAP